MSSEDKKTPVVFNSEIVSATIVSENQPQLTVEAAMQDILEEFKKNEPAADMQELLNFLSNIVQVKNGSKKRLNVLPGFTRKIKVLRPNNRKVSIYITINHVYENEKFWPFEIFFNCSDTRLAGWLAALGKIVSALMKSMKEMRADADFIADNLSSIESDSYFDGESKTWVSSIQAHIGLVIRQNNQTLKALEREIKEANNIAAIVATRQKEKSYDMFYDVCPACGQKKLVVSGGCKNCENCDYTGGCG